MNYRYINQDAVIVEDGRAIHPKVAIEELAAEVENMNQSIVTACERVGGCFNAHDLAEEILRLRALTMKNDA